MFITEELYFLELVFFSFLWYTEVMTFSIFSIAFSLFLLMDPLGNIPLFVVLLETLERKRQQKVILREAFFALILIVIFALIGDNLMEILHISHETIFIAGGIVLFMIALNMIFPARGGLQEVMTQGDDEPFIFPLAIPLIAGPSVLAAVMIYSYQELPLYSLIIAILIAWGTSTVILLASPWIKNFLGKRGIKAIEKLMGLILVLISIQMFLDGLVPFVAQKSVVAARMV